MCDVYIVLYEAYLGPKASDLRVYPVIKCEGASEETGATHDHSQVKKHGKSLWNQMHKFHLVDPRKEVPLFDIEFFTKCKLRDDEMLASTMLDEGTMRGFVFGLCKVHDVKLKMRSTEELSHFNLTSSVNKRQHDYYVKYRLLITAAGVDPSPRQLEELKALSPTFDPSAEKQNDDDSDPDEEKALDKATAVVAELNRTPIFRLLRQFIFAVVAAATAVNGIMQLSHQLSSAVQADDFDWTLTRTTDGNRCVALFDQMDAVKQDSDTVVYSYNVGGSTVGVCTDRDKSPFDSEIGADYLYDAVADKTGGACTLPGYYAQNDVITTSGYDMNSYNPRPYGIMWYLSAQEGSSSSPHNCAITWRPALLNENWADCSKANVYVYRHTASIIMKYIFYFSLAFTFSRLFVEMRGILSFHLPQCAKLCYCCGPTIGFTGHKSIFYRMSSRGFFGPMSLLWRMVRGCTTRVAPIDPPPLILDVLLYLLETIPNIVLPLYGVWGCKTGSWKLIILVILGIIKTLIMTGIFGKDIFDRIKAWKNSDVPDDLHDSLFTHSLNSYSPPSSTVSMQSINSRGHYMPPANSSQLRVTNQHHHQHHNHLQQRKQHHQQHHQHHSQNQHFQRHHHHQQHLYHQQHHHHRPHNHNVDLTSTELLPSQMTDSTAVVVQPAVLEPHPVAESPTAVDHVSETEQESVEAAQCSEVHATQSEHQDNSPSEAEQHPSVS